jgi:hypothetical protein
MGVGLLGSVEKEEQEKMKCAGALSYQPTRTSTLHFFLLFLFHRTQ